MLSSILTSATTPSVALEEFLICSAASLILGFALAWIHTYKNQVTKNFIMTLVLLPVIVQTVIMLVNGNLGTGVAVMGAFSLVRFRSMPGNSREIVSVFLAMAIGLAAGMGYLGVAAVLLVIVGVITVIMAHLPVLDSSFRERELKITIPENLDYQGVFDDLFDTYTNKAELIRVRTVNMGSLYELQYIVNLKHADKEKEFLDQVRCRNGNLSLVCGRIPAGKETL